MHDQPVTSGVGHGGIVGIGQQPLACRFYVGARAASKFFKQKHAGDADDDDTVLIVENSSVDSDSEPAGGGQQYSMASPTTEHEPELGVADATDTPPPRRFSQETPL